MNKKGKNKRNKNNPVQNEQATSEEKVEEVIKIVESVERVPEILSDVAPVPEVQDDTPKKPKRNRGKKKKGKDDDEETMKEETVEETGDVKALIVEATEEKTAEVVTVLLTTRKQKNKNKRNELPIENVEVVPKDILTGELSNPEVKEDILESLSVLEGKEELKLETQHQEVKPSKKKNKKKKRSDSEKSEKEDTSCTTAFQQLLVAADLEDKIENKASDQLPLMDIPLGAEVFEVKFEQNKDNDSENIKAPGPSNDDKKVKEASIFEIKSKKKNKKDKKHAQVENTLEYEFKTEQPANKPTIEILTENITEETKDKTTVPFDSLVEESCTTPKAKIAKPVEKKRIEKLNVNDSIADLTKSQEVEKVTETMETNRQATVEVIDILDIPLTSKQPKEDDKATQELIVPDNAMGKKRKKSQKTPKQIESSELHEQITKVEPAPTESDFSKEPVCLQVEEPKEYADQICAKAEDLVEPIQEDTTKLITDTGIELLSSDITEPKDTTEDKQPKQKTSKKRRKSPRLPTKLDEIKTDQSLYEPVDTRKIDEQAVTEQLEDLNIKASKEEGVSKNQTQTTIEVSKLDDVEIRSLTADESEGSACEVTPEILYPRSTSQQRLDDNNNMVIRELLPSDNILDMPIVLGCVDVPKTPEPTPEKNIVGESSKPTEPFKMSKIVQNLGGKTGKQEKTDLKSKMMEVNQDMEELRLSIEKSLAELTSIERSEESVEKKVEEAKEIIAVTVDSKTPEIKAEEISPGTETPVSLQIKTKEGTPDKHDKVHIDKAGNTSNIKESSVFLKDQKPINIPKIDEIIEAASLSKDKALLIPKDSKHTETQVGTVESVTSSTEATIKKDEKKEIAEPISSNDTPPICPTRKDNKGKHKKKKGKQDSQSTAQSSNTTATATNIATTTESKETKKDETKSDKTETKSDKTEAKSDNKDKGKQQADIDSTETEYEPIDNFEDALTSSVDDVNKTFEMIVNEGNEQTNPKINIIAPDEEKINKVQPPKNLLGHPDIPVQSNKSDYKKEKNKTPNESQAKVKIKDAVNIDKHSKNTQTTNKIVKNSKNDTLNIDNEYVYKYNFRKVFLQSACHVCKKELTQRVACGFCNLVFYCSTKHKDEDWPCHQALCFAVSTIVHLKDQKHIYSDVKNITGHDYRLMRMQMIVSCEKVLKRRLVPWEQEALLYPRVCALVGCREWRQGKLRDCEGCGQISYCSEAQEHLPKAHQRWCKSYCLYQKLVSYQQTKGRLEPKLPGKVMHEVYHMPDKINEVLASMYEEKIDMNDIQYAALTQIATAPLTAAYSHQVHRNTVKITNGVSKKTSFTIHVVGAELQFEADALNKWEVFFLHLRPDLQELRVVLVNYNLNPSRLPLELLGKVKLCEDCCQKNRRVIFHFEDKKTYPEYRTSEDFAHPDLICAFNPSIQRSSVYNGKDQWPSTIKTIIKLKTPWLVTGYTMTELRRDMIRIKECSENPYNVVAEPKLNSFASVRPDRNFISDDEIPLLFKNYCYAILCG